VRNSGTSSAHPRIGIYARVSRNDGVQDVENQLHELRAWAERLGDTNPGVFQDEASGIKDTDERPGLARLLDAAHHRHVDVVLVWSLDRLTRNGGAALETLIRRFQASGVILKSHRESWLDTTSPLVAELLINIFGWLARQEREHLRERIKAGLARARRQGKRLGRRRLSCGNVDYIRQTIAKTGSIRKAARVLDVSEATLRNRLSERRAVCAS
jgi:DNA invertase Pin-like site-specific DNA recombinase